MARPLIGTKLHVPGLRQGRVDRPRLRELVAGGGRARLTLVSAPAGFGKTTLLSEWAQEARSAGRAVAWVSLDGADNEPGSFWTYLLTALDTAAPGLAADALASVESAPPAADGALTQLLNALAAAPADVWLVLDDYHVVVDQGVREGLTFLLEHLPPQVHVVVSTRADPDLPLARWRVRGELVEIRAADLRFNAEEAAAYLSVTAGLDLTAGDVAALEERTEGWIAALQLAALSLRGRADVSSFIARFTGTDRYVVDYLVEEVLAHQPDEVRDFLLQTAVLDRLTGSLCDALTGRDDGNGTLATLERANLFLVPRDDGREWYRYHHLFADVLRARLLAEQPHLVEALHQRASTWYERQDLLEEAVRHSFEAQDFDRAAYLVELTVPSIRRHRREAVLMGWLRALPDSAVRRSPVLSVFYGYMLMVSGDLPGVAARFDDAERALAAGQDASAPWADTHELRTLPATLAIHRASLAQALGDTTGTVLHARRALELAGPDDHLARGGAAGFLGLAAWSSGDVVGALTTFSDAVASLHAAGNLVDELSSTVILGDLWVAAGRPSRARRLYERSMEVAEAHGEPVARAAATLHVGLGELDYDAGDLDGAANHLEASATLGERAPMTESDFRWFVAQSRLAAALGDSLGALAHLDRAADLYRPGFFPEVRPIAAMRARLHVSRGELAQAQEWASERSLTTDDDVRYLGEYDHLTLVRLVIAEHRALREPTTLPEPTTEALDRAIALLGRLEEAAESTGRAGSLLEIRALTALAQEARGDRGEALQSLSRAWAESPEPDGYARVFLDEGAPMVELLRVAARQGSAADGAHRLLRLCGEGAPVGRRLMDPPADQLSDRELQVLRLLDSDLTGPEIARELFVSHNTLRTHTKHIFTKLDVTSRRAAVRAARDRGLL